MVSFRRIDYNSEIPWFVKLINEESDNLIITFSSSPDSFDWYNSLEKFSLEISFSRFYLSDMCNVWWHGNYKEINGFGPLSLFGFLEKEIKEISAKKILCMGSSRGGYGAILFGCLLNADLVLAFSPQTRITPGLDKKYQIISKINDLKNTILNFEVDEELTDLRNIIERYGKNNKTIYKLFYGSENSGDETHAKYISQFKGTEFHTTETSSHKTSKIFLNNGTVEKLIRNFIGDNNDK